MCETNPKSRRWRLLRHRSAAQAFILAHPLYPPLVEQQERYWTLGTILELDRQLATLDRIEHLSRLARLREGIHAWAADDSLDAYRRLLACEDRPL